MLKYVRIAVTALSLTACVLLIALWVRSYYVADAITGYTTNNNSILLSSFWGRTLLSIGPPIQRRLAVGADIRHSKYAVGEWIAVPQEVTTSGFGAHWGDNGIVIMSPLWFLATLAGVVAVLPWVARRFSLRTLLIAMTLVAVALGLVVALS